MKRIAPEEIPLKGGQVWRPTKGTTRWRIIVRTETRRNGSLDVWFQRLSPDGTPGVVMFSSERSFHDWQRKHGAVLDGSERSATGTVIEHAFEHGSEAIRQAFEAGAQAMREAIAARFSGDQAALDCITAEPIPEIT